MLCIGRPGVPLILYTVYIYIYTYEFMYIYIYIYMYTAYTVYI